MLLSRACEYGLRATFYIAAQKPDGYLPIRAIGETLGISVPFLTKVLQQLTQADLLASFRGPNGGIALARPADQITLYDIVVAVDGPGLFVACVLGLPGCGSEKPCPLHEGWAVERDRLRALFLRTTLDDVAHRLQGADLRLANLPARLD